MRKVDNKGFTLIEMLVSVLITGLMMLGVATFVSSSRMSFSKVNTSVSLQEEASTTVKFLNEIVIESKEWGQITTTYSSGSDSSEMYVLWLRALDNESSDASDREECMYFIIWEKANDCIRYKKVEIGTGTGQFDKATYLGKANDERVAYINNLLADAYFDDYSLVSRYVDSVSLTQDMNNPKKFSIKLLFMFNGETYSANVNSVARNDK